MVSFLGVGLEFRNMNTKVISFLASFIWQFTLSSFRAWPPSFWRAWPGIHAFVQQAGFPRSREWREPDGASLANGGIHGKKCKPLLVCYEVCLIFHCNCCPIC